MGTPLDYQVGKDALAAVLATAIKPYQDEIPVFMKKQIQDIINTIDQNGSRAVIDAVDAARAKINQGT